MNTLDELYHIAQLVSKSLNDQLSVGETVVIKAWKSKDIRNLQLFELWEQQRNVEETIHFLEDTDQGLEKILDGSASDQELLCFAQWVEDEENRLYFQQYKEIWHTTTRVPWEKEEVILALEDYRRYIYGKQQRKPVRLWIKMMKYAAVVVVGIVGGYYGYVALRQERMPLERTIMAQTTTVPLLIRSDGTTVDLTQSDTILTEKDGTLLERTDAYTISYRNEASESSEMIYNTLQIPKGKRFNVELSDGTWVWLNAGSTLIYPVNFKGKTRTVQLDGQAYFEVKKDSLHPFIVKSGELETKVLGTSFDINAYRGKGETSLILVEGRVEAKSFGKIVLVRPDQQLTLDTLTHRMWLKEVDARALTSWKDGVLQLDNQTFPEMLDKLALWYGVTFIDESEIPVSAHFNGRFDRENIRQAMETIAISAHIIYEIRQDTIIIQSKY